MLPNADVLLLDEPTAALDPDGLRAFYALVAERRAQGRTVLFTSHQVDDVDLADRALVMAKGRLAADYTRDRLRAWRDARGLMRVRVDDVAARVIERIRHLVTGAVVEADEIRIPGPAGGRHAVLDAIRSTGASIVGLSAEDGRLDVLYAEILAAAAQEDLHD